MEMHHNSDGLVQPCNVCHKA